MSKAHQAEARINGDAARSGKEATKEDTPLPPENTKEGIRARIWNHLEKNDLVNFPRPVHHRIPNFKDAEIAADKIKTMEPFQKARTVKINPDKPQQQARFNTLEAGKRLLVPTPRLRQGLFNKITPPENATKDDLRVCSTAQGVKEFSSPISLDDTVTVDLVIVGSVAVSKKGYRIGKGEGFADLEWAMMSCMRAVKPETIIITTVHDDQVVDIPDDLVQDHDISVDYIVTPTQVIKCPKRAKPTGIFWSKLTREKLQQVPILKRLRERERAEEKDVTLWDEIEGNEAPPRERRPRRHRNSSRRSTSDKENVEDGKESDTTTDRRRRERRPRRRKDSRRGRGTSQSEGEDKDASGDGEEGKGDRPRQQRRPKGPRGNRGSTVSVFVGGLPRATRVSALKVNIRERDVQPLALIWHGGSGHAFLLFPEEDAAQDALKKLTGIEMNGKALRIEMANRRRRSRSRSKGSESKSDAPEVQAEA